MKRLFVVGLVALAAPVCRAEISLPDFHYVGAANLADLPAPPLAAARQVQGVAGQDRVIDGADEEKFLRLLATVPSTERLDVLKELPDSSFDAFSAAGVTKLFWLLRTSHGVALDDREVYVIGRLTPKFWAKVTAAGFGDLALSSTSGGEDKLINTAPVAFWKRMNAEDMESILAKVLSRKRAAVVKLWIKAQKPL